MCGARYSLLLAVCTDASSAPSTSLRSSSSGYLPVYRPKLIILDLILAYPFVSLSRNMSLPRSPSTMVLRLDIHAANPHLPPPKTRPPS